MPPLRCLPGMADSPPDPAHSQSFRPVALHLQPQECEPVSILLFYIQPICVYCFLRPPRPIYVWSGFIVSDSKTRSLVP